jgi:hypothetical protein
MTARHDRGRRTNRVVAAWLAEHGWPGAKATYGSEPGKDIKEGVPGHSIEVKARADFNPKAWLRQAQKSAAAGERPCAIVRMNGQGEDAGEYLVFRRLEDDELNRERA